MGSSVRGARALSQRMLVAVAAVAGGLVVVLALVFAATSADSGTVVTSPAWTDALTVLGGPVVLPLVTAVLVVVLAAAGRGADARFLFAAVAGAGLLTYLVKGVLQVLGADHDGGRLADYPSGHEAVTMAFLLALLAIAWPHVTGRAARAGVVVGVLLLAALMGWSRVEAGAHGPLDVVGGAALAIGWVAVCLLAWPPAPRERA